MKPLGLAAAVLTLASPVAAPADERLRYQFPAGQTNVYEVSITTMGPDRPYVFGGVLSVHFKESRGDVGCISMLGSIRPAPLNEGQGQNMIPPILRGPMGMRAGPPFMLRWTQFQHSFEASVDAQGRIVRESGRVPDFPAPFRNMAELILHPLPPEDSSEWSTTVETFVPDETEMDGRMGRPWVAGFHPAMGLSTIAVRRTLQGRAEFTSETAATITSRIELVSLLADPSPRLRASGVTTVNFDRERGCVRSLDFVGESMIELPTFTQRRPLTVAIRLLEGAEAAAALQPEEEAAAPAGPIAGEELDRLLKDLRSPEPHVREAAAQRLNAGSIEEPTEALVEAAFQLATESPPHLRDIGLRLVGAHATEEHASRIINLLRAIPAGSKQPLIEAITRLGDPRAAEPLADLVAEGGPDAHFAAEALGTLGHGAERAALRLLEQRHFETRRRACEILGRVGERDALEALTSLLTHPDQQLSHVAAEAVRSIQIRLAINPGAPAAAENPH